MTAAEAQGAATAARAAAGRRRALLAGFALAIVLQLVALYAPSTGDAPSIPGADKLVHLGIFLLPALLGVLAGVRPLWLGLALVAHAGASEVVQHLLLPERSGDVWDAVADVVGVGIGVAVGVALRRRGQARAAAS